MYAHLVGTGLVTPQEFWNEYTKKNVSFISFLWDERWNFAEWSHRGEEWNKRRVPREHRAAGWREWSSTQSQPGNHSVHLQHLSFRLVRFSNYSLWKFQIYLFKLIIWIQHLQWSRNILSWCLTKWLSRCSGPNSSNRTTFIGNERFVFKHGIPFINSRCYSCSW